MCSAFHDNRHGRIGRAVQALKQSGFYWGGITNQQAKALLKDTSVGSFLVRDSSDQRYLFTLTLKTSIGVTSVRIVMEKMTFRVDSGGSKALTPSFDCVVRLVHYYMQVYRTNRPMCDSQGMTTKDARGLLLLRYPLYKGVQSLQHLCRRTVNQVTRPESIHKLPVAHHLQIYLRNYPYSC